MNYKVEEKPPHFYYVMGLETFGLGASENVLLIYSYLTGDIDTNLKNADMMLGALYDLYQTHDGLHENDTFETPYGNFKCVGVHVVPNNKE